MFTRLINNAICGDRVAQPRGWMQGARAQQGLRLASAGNAADGPLAGQPEGKACQGAPLGVALLVRADARTASRALIGPPWQAFATPQIALLISKPNI